MVQYSVITFKYIMYLIIFKLKGNKYKYICHVRKTGTYTNNTKLKFFNSYKNILLEIFIFLKIYRRTFKNRVQSKRSSIKACMVIVGKNLF